MRAKTRLALSITLILSAIALVAEYIILSFYYAEGFSYGTWINGVYCTGKAVTQVNEELLRNENYDGLTVTGRDNSTIHIDPADIHLRLDYTRPLQSYMDRQIPFAWGINLFRKDSVIMLPEVIYDEDELAALINEWVARASEPTGDEVRIEPTDSGYQLVNDLTEQPAADNIISYARAAIVKKEETLDISEEPDAYEATTPTPEQEDIIAVAQEIDELQSYELSYTDEAGEGEAIVDSQEVASWIVTQDDVDALTAIEQTDDAMEGGAFIVDGRRTDIPEDTHIVAGFVTDKEGHPVVSVRRIREFVESLAQDYGTAEQMDNYRATSDKAARDAMRIVIPGDESGRIIDEDAEFDYLVKSFIEGRSEKHEPFYTDGTMVITGDMLGSEYIEVDMGAQQLTYYKDDRIVQQFPVVTGLMTRARKTPTGYYRIYNKRRSTILRGYDYSTFVNYWLGVHGGIGIHDATWRSSFGGDIYINSGSHGCINSPKDEMERLYNAIEVGVPVVMFY